MAITVRVKTDNVNMMPVYGSDAAAGADLRAALSEPLDVDPGGRCAIPTGLQLEIPHGYEGQVRPRSGLALKTGLTVLNAPGTIDSDYRGEVKVILVNTSNERVTISPAERIAQLVIAPVERVQFELSGSLGETKRGEGGFGSTGIS